MVQKKEFIDDLMKLWRDTFGDSAEYVRLMVDAYFVEENVEVCLNEKGKLVSALWSVPYRFTGGKMAGERCGYLRGLYLCGLATDPEYRQQGIMSKLMNRIESRAAKDDYDFCFLIPADENLEKYYERRGYVSCYGKLKCTVSFESCNIDSISFERTVAFKDDRREYNLVNSNRGIEISEDGFENLRFEELKIYGDEFENLLLQNESKSLSCFNILDDNFDSEIENGFEMKYRILRQCHAFMSEYERNLASYSILHSWRDFIAAIRENNISGGKVVALQDSDCKPFALIFCYYNKEKKSIDIRFCASQTEDCKALMLLYLKLCCFRDAEKAMMSQGIPANSKSNVRDLDRIYRFGSPIGEDVYISLQSDARGACKEKYGMMKWLSGAYPEERSGKDKETVKFFDSQEVENFEKLTICNVRYKDLRINESKTEKEAGSVKENLQILEDESGNDFDSKSCKCNQIAISDEKRDVEVNSEALDSLKKSDEAKDFEISESDGPKSRHLSESHTTERYLNISLMLD